MPLSALSGARVGPGAGTWTSTLLACAVGIAPACGDNAPEQAGSPDAVAQDAASADATGSPNSDSRDATGCEDVRATAEGLVFGACGAQQATLLPRVRVSGEWLGGGQVACTAEGMTVRCPAGDAGTAIATAEGPRVTLAFEATRAVLVEAFSLEGTADLPGATAWLSNGFQSWSQSGVVALGAPPTDEALEDALAQRGTAETLRWGGELSWWHTWVGGGSTALVAGVTDAQLFRAWTQTTKDTDGVRVRLVNGGTGDTVAVAKGARLEGDPWWVAVGPDLHDMLDAYAGALRTRSTTVAAPAEAGWNSWYDLWDTVDEQAVRDNAPLARAILEPLLPDDAPPLRIVVDDGWQVAWGEWTPNGKFPSGLSGLSTDLRAQGYTTGVWLAPLLVDADSALVTDHPEWFVGGAVYKHPVHGAMRVLDVTHPAAAEHLRTTIATIVAWGMDLLKIDFLFAGTWEGARHEPVTGMQAYVRAMQVIREGAGEDTVLLAVGAPALGTLPYVDAWRVGGDIALEPLGPQWSFVANQARSVAARWFVCQATLCDADPPLLRTLDRHEVEAGGWVAALAGGALFLSDDLRALPEERHGWGLDAERARVALSGAASRPVDLVPATPPERLQDPAMDVITSTDSHIVPVVWELPVAGRLGLNVTSEPLDVQGTTVAPHSAAILQ